MPAALRMVILIGALVAPAMRIVAADGSAAVTNATSAGTGVQPSDALTFEQHIWPIFRAHCFDCHGATEERAGGLDLRLVRFMLAGGDSGSALTPGDPAGSYLIDRLRNGEMPPGESRVPDAEIATIERWIRDGAKTVREEPASIPPGLGVTFEERSFWSFQPIARPTIPEFPPDARVRTPIDALVLAAMPDGLSFSVDADRLHLIRRAYLDVTGLPPTPDQMQSWLDDSRPDWFERLIDALLESPHYGERWGRHWLDVAGYADSEGFTVNDAERAWAWKYRDWVIRAVNEDRPIDQFLTQQLAGDELAGPRNGDLTAEQIDLLTATGFLRMAADGTGSGANTPEARNQVMADTLKIVGTSLLGLSLQCAQCHDHRYDPIPQADYFALRAVFEPALNWQNWLVPQQRQISLYTAADREQAAMIEQEAQQVATDKGTRQTGILQAELEKQLLRVEDESQREPLRVAWNTAGGERTEPQNQLLASYPFVRDLSPGSLYLYDQKAADELKTYDQKIGEIRARKPPEQFLRSLSEPAGNVPETKLFHRGDFQQPRETVAPAALTVTAPPGERQMLPLDDDAVAGTGRRLALARWLTSGRHPLVARVFVNRVWLHHFGRGLVATPSDFGKLGSRPSHPQLLDFLADEFMRQGWSLKSLHRLILTSTVWRQSSHVAAPSAEDANSPMTDDRARLAMQSDPANRFYWRYPVSRLEAEIIRDRMLLACGTLDPSVGGGPVAIKEDETGQVVVDGNQTRRSLYIQSRRSRPVGMLQAFDAPVMETNCEVRPSSTVASQSLILMNGEFTLHHARQLAERVAREAVMLSPGELSTLPALPDPPEPAWQMGFGAFDESQNRTVPFERLPHWTGSQWQGGAALPDSRIGWVLLHAGGGHPGEAAFSAIRRWTAPSPGKVSITGRLEHGSENGDGVRGRIVSSRSGLAGAWTAAHSTADTPAAGLQVEAGDTIDFITDCIATVSSDSFSWPVTIELTPTDSPAQRFESAKEFAGPVDTSRLLPGQAVLAWRLALGRSPEHVELVGATQFLADQLEFLFAHPDLVPPGTTAQRQAMTNLCQALLSSNEFLYTD